MEIDNLEKGHNMVVVGAGGSLKDFKSDIVKFIDKVDGSVIGINKMTDFYFPKYHLWTNRQRWGSFGSCINSGSILLFGPSIKKKAIRQHYHGPINRLDYVDKKGEKVNYKDGVIRGHFRTAGCLAVMVCAVMKAKNIYIVGMDGFTLHGRKEIKKGKKDHHCYGKGYTDDATWEECKAKDKAVDDALHEIDKYGVKFKILTPTKFSDFYHKSIFANG